MEVLGRTSSPMLRFTRHQQQRRNDITPINWSRPENNQLIKDHFHPRRCSIDGGSGKERRKIAPITEVRAHVNHRKQHQKKMIVRSWSDDQYRIAENTTKDIHNLKRRRTEEFELLHGRQSGIYSQAGHKKRRRDLEVESSSSSQGENPNDAHLLTHMQLSRHRMCSSPNNCQSSSTRVSLFPSVEARDVYPDQSFGCVVFLQEGTSVTSSFFSDVSLGVRDYLRMVEKEEPESALYHLVAKHEDSSVDIFPAIDRYLQEEKEETGACANLIDDIVWWNENPSWAFFRRLLLPVVVVIEHNRSMFLTDFSFIDVILQNEDTQAVALEALIMRLHLLVRHVQEDPNETAKECHHVWLKNQILDAILRVNRKGIINHSKLPPTNFLFAFEPQLKGCFFNSQQGETAVGNELPNASEYKQFVNEWMGRFHLLSKQDNNPIEARSCLPHLRSKRDAVLKERKRLLDQFNEQQQEAASKREMGDHVTGVPPSLKRLSSVDDDELIVTRRQMPFNAFADKVQFMKLVNDTIPRPFYPNHSRPRLQRVNNLSKDKVKAIKRLFFDRDGSLKSSIRRDVDCSTKHGYINFENASCTAERHDKRWQVPIKQHLYSLTGNNIRTRRQLEKLLDGVLFDFGQETLNDVGILIGGTEDQSLHHDVARQYVRWLPEEGSEVGAIAGWEVGRIQYNEAMASKYAPCSMIMGMGPKQDALLGVQKDQIRRLGNNKCSVIGGEPDVSFDIVRENESLVVIRVNPGCIFTGDFPHAGVRNFSVGTKEDALMEKLTKRIDNALEMSETFCDQTKAVLNVLCNFPGLDRICRLHLSTEMLYTEMRVPRNAVGFTKCAPNFPDPRCVEQDATDSDDEYEFDDEDDKDNEEDFEMSISSLASAVPSSDEEQANESHSFLLPPTPRGKRNKRRTVSYTLTSDEEDDDSENEFQAHEFKTHLSTDVSDDISTTTARGECKPIITPLGSPIRSV